MKDLNGFNSFYHKRLMREYKYLQENPIENMTAQPLETDITEWHINIKPYDPYLKGIYFHIVLNFPNNYPQKGPKIKVMHYIDHPNVFNGYLCLDILNEIKTIPWRGWSSAYNITSILTQLQLVLLDVENSGNMEKKEEMVLAAQNYYCHKCGHSHKAPHPIKLNTVVNKVGQKQHITKNSRSSLGPFNDELLGIFFLLLILTIWRN
eukprot:UN24639